MTLHDTLTSVMFALRFSLDQYTNWYNSPSAAMYFWSAFTLVLLVIIALMLWVFRSMRPH